VVKSYTLQKKWLGYGKCREQKTTGQRQKPLKIPTSKEVKGVCEMLNTMVDPIEILKASNRTYEGKGGIKTTECMVSIYEFMQIALAATARGATFVSFWATTKSCFKASGTKLGLTKKTHAQGTIGFDTQAKVDRQREAAGLEERELKPRQWGTRLNNVFVAHINKAEKELAEKENREPRTSFYITIYYDRSLADDEGIKSPRYFDANANEMSDEEVAPHLKPKQEKEDLMGYCDYGLSSIDQITMTIKASNGNPAHRFIISLAHM
jgi:hypothetical protein